MEPLRVYSSNTCPNCDNLKKALSMKKVPFQEINITEQPEAAQVVREKGFRNLPVIELNGDWMAGFTQANFIKILQAQPVTAE